MHTNDGHCQKCSQIFDIYPGFYQPLRDWFNSIQSKFSDAHISCAGRGAADQKHLFEFGLTRAAWGKSAHNWNAAIDIFQLKNGQAVWDRGWFLLAVYPALTPEINWYGRVGASFPELPHCEWSQWNQAAKAGILKLIDS